MGLYVPYHGDTDGVKTALPVLETALSSPIARPSRAR